jgi:hypothetical protein
VLVLWSGLPAITKMFSKREIHFWSLVAANPSMISKGKPSNLWKEDMWRPRFWLKNMGVTGRL